MSKPKGAFVEACEYIINKDMENKKLLMEDIIKNPNKYPKFTGEQLFELIFGDYQNFVNKWIKYDP